MPDPGGVAQSVEQAAHNRCVVGSSPASATRGACRVRPGRPDRTIRPRQTAPSAREGCTVATKTADIRPKITMACTECKERNYITRKNRRNDPDRLELKKFCPRCGRHTSHRETR